MSDTDRRRRDGHISQPRSTPVVARALATGLLLALVLAPGAGRSQSPPVADALPPWAEPPLPDWVRSVRVLESDEPLFARPEQDASRRGSAARESLLPVFGQVVSSGCGAPWLQVGARAWLCGDRASLSGESPVSAGTLALPPGPDGLPLRYYFVSQDGSLAYDRFEEVDIGEPSMELEPGFAVAIVDERWLGGEPYGRTNRGLWVPMRDIHPANPLVFSGAELEGAAGVEIHVGWVTSERATILAQRGPGFMATSRSLPRFTQIAITEERHAAGGSYVRVDDDAWIAARDVRRPTTAPPPTEIDASAEERWIDVELATQTLVAYEGTRPVFATLVSTGKGAQGTGNATPKGTHRIWIKLLTSVMDNLEDEDANRYYRMEDVPYVQYFSKGVGLHAAYWHRSFGRVRSHGCVNLSPNDAARLFGWTTPRMPAGWTAVLPTAADRATVIRVR